MKNKASNAWVSGREYIAPVERTRFEVLVDKLGLSIEDYVDSLQLKEWVLQNYNDYYVPEWLLEKWKLVVDDFKYHNFFNVHAVREAMGWE